MRTRTPFGGAVCVLVCLLATASPASSATISVPAGGNLQDALDAAQPGDVILLEPGATYVGSFVLPNKGALGDYITVRSAAPDASLPPAGIRMTPVYAALLPKIKSSTSTSAVRTEAGANHWKLQFLEFQANLAGFGEIISFGAGDSTQTMASQVPYELMIDRIYVHGDPLFGQKRCIALNSRDTVVVNSYVTDCKAIGQDSQAIGGFNGPGNFRIENNYLEGAAENVLIGGADPTIPNLVTTNITFRHNHLPKPLAWRDPIVTTPTGVSAQAVPGGGSLGAGTYAYRVAARMTSNQNNKATSASSVQVSTTTAGTGGVRVSWTAIPGAEQYLVYGRTTSGQTMYWKTSDTYFTDTGTTGTTVGSPSTIEKPTYAGTKWAVKNTFELKNAQDVLVEGNVFEYLWVADQTGYPIVFTPRNQSGRAPWTVVQRVTFKHNLVRHTAGGVNILGIDNVNPSQRTNTITITHNVFDDLTAASWGSGSRPITLGDGPDNVIITHNTIFSTNPQLMWLYGAPVTNSVFTHNMAKHNTYGIMANGVAFGNASITQYFPGLNNVTANVIAGGSASKYPPGNFFPTVSAWTADFPNYATGDYRLGGSSAFKGIGLEGKDLGADIDTLDKHVPIALSGRDDQNVLKILPTALHDGVFNQSYAESVSCAGNTGSCVFSASENSLPAGLAFDAIAGLVSGVPLEARSGSIRIDASDSERPENTANITLSVTIAPPPMAVAVPPVSEAQVGAMFVVIPAVTGAMGATTWSVVSGELPPGLVLDPISGAVGGVPATHGSFTVAVLARDSWAEPREASGTATITVLPAALAIDPAALANGLAGTPYSAVLTATGGTGATVWSVKPGSALPEGMALDATGAIVGTPASPASFNFTIVATDAVYSQIHAEATLALTVDAPAPTEPPKPVREIVLYAADAAPVAGKWSIVDDGSAAGGKRVWNKDLAAPKLTAALASPANYFELTFNADAGVGYHLWLRGKADRDGWANDSVFVQFSGSVNASGAAIHRIGTTSAATVSIEEGSNAGLAGWGWADDSYGGFAAPLYFAATGPQTIRIQVREDGLSLDQVVLSADRFATRAPGATKNDTTVLTTAAGDPTITIDAASLGNATYGAAYAAMLAATGSTGSTTWSVVSGQLPEGLTLSAAGALNGTPASLGEFTFTVRAQDTAWQANVATSPVTLIVVAPTFGVNALAPPPAMVGQPYATAFTATGNVGGVAWTLTSGDLPAGLTLDGVSGTIGGQPTAWGVFAAIVQGADSLGRVELAPITIVVSPTPLTISTTTLVAAAYHAAYSAAMAAEGGTGAVVWTLAAGSLPAGLTLDANSGVISGIPAQAGNFVFDVRAVDTNWEGDADTRSITLEVQPPVFSAAIAPAAVAGRVGMALQGLVGHAQGNVGDVRWSLVSGALPGGVVLDSVGGTISGTPTAFGHFTAGVKAEDMWNASRLVVSTVTIEVAPIALAVVTETLASANVGQAYAATVAANGGTGLTTWRVSGGALPAGVTLGANGAFSGMPAAAGTFTFTVEATDAGWAGNIATKALTLAVGVREVVLYAAEATRVAGKWAVVADPSAAVGARMANPDAAAAKLSTALANPANYFEMTFQAQAGVAYHLWLRGKADKNGWANDSAFVQFSGSVDANGNPVNRIGTTGAATVSIEDGTNAGLSGWGWSDDAYGGFGSAMYFATTGTHTVRIQVREDGLSLDQFVLSADRYATVAPGATKNDATILAR